MVLALFVTDPDANTEDEAGPSDIQDEEEEVELELEDETTEAGDIEERTRRSSSVSPFPKNPHSRGGSYCPHFLHCPKKENSK